MTAFRFAEGPLKATVSKTNQDHAASKKKIKVVPVNVQPKDGGSGEKGEFY